MITRTDFSSPALKILERRVKGECQCRSNIYFQWFQVSKLSFTLQKFGEMFRRKKSVKAPSLLFFLCSFGKDPYHSFKFIAPSAYNVSIEGTPPPERIKLRVSILIAAAAAGAAESINWVMNDKRCSVVVLSWLAESWRNARRPTKAKPSSRAREPSK